MGDGYALLPGASFHCGWWGERETALTPALSPEEREIRRTASGRFVVRGCPLLRPERTTPLRHPFLPLPGAAGEASVKMKL